MKKTKTAIILLLTILNHNLIAQATDDAPKSYIGDINKIFTAAPTSNNLMKFEEVPVSYYSGIPNISIPLISIPTINSKVGIDVSLKYHPLNAKPDDRAGETGLGWSLIAGGTISRTVRGGNPDELNRMIAFSSPPKPKYGIYFETNNLNPTGRLLRGESFNLENYSFDAAMGRFDTEYDLYQYNFMNKSGRFYISKDSSGNLVIEKLDKNNDKISVEFDSSGLIGSFAIVDDNGISYIFTGLEKSSKSLLSTKIGLATGAQIVTSGSEMPGYWAAFHLTSIRDQNNVLLATFNYTLAEPVKYSETTAITKRIASNVTYVNTTQSEGSGIQQSPDGSMPGAFETQTTNNSSVTRLLTSITIERKGTIYLNYEKGRLDTNYLEPENMYKLKSIQSNFNGQDPLLYTDKYVFDYSYSDTSYRPKWQSPTTLKKLLLRKVTKVSPANQNQEYTLDYDTTTAELEKDRWGYYKGGGNDGFKADVLHSMIYPTKGKTVFNFGKNDYSHFFSGAGMETVSGHWETHGAKESVNFGAFSPTNKKYFFTVNTAQDVQLHMSLGNLIYYNWTLKVFRKNTDNTFTEVYSFGYMPQACNRPQPPACMVINPNVNGEIISEFDDVKYLAPGIYYASLEGQYLTNLQDDTFDNFDASTTENVFYNEKKRSGGGLRIDNISYFDDSASAIPSKQYMYEYNDITDFQKSSGSLVFPEPAMNAVESFSYRNKLNAPSITYNASFAVETNYNIYPSEKTQGSDVGYRYVTVKQSDKYGNSKGKTVYTFRSPFEFPNIGELTPVFPVLTIPNLDYLRGQQISEKIYDETGRPLSETTTDYTTVEFEKSSGVKIYDNMASNMVAQYYTYSTYQDMVNHLGSGTALTTPYKNFEHFGMTLPAKNKNRSYFYKNGVESSVLTSTDTVYNLDDYPTEVTRSIQGGDTYVSSYKYAKEKNNQRLISANMIGIPLETETKKNGQTKEKTETLYTDPNLLLPSSVQSTGLTGISYTELTYEKYDSNGNLQQYRTKEGYPISIIWGYNNTLPIAKVEGTTYDEAMALIGASDIVSKSDQDIDIPKQNALIAQLDSFRKNNSRYFITTYTYDPLIGVTSITPPSGIREVYLYDTANRLMEIREGSQTGKILKEFKYNYKN